MFKLKLLLIMLVGVGRLYAQQREIDSLNQLLLWTRADSSKIFLYEKLAETYRDAKKLDSSISSYKQAVAINERSHFWPLKKCWDISTIAYLLYVTGNYSESLRYGKEEMELGQKLGDTLQISASYLVLGHDYRELGDYRKSLSHFFASKAQLAIYYAAKKEPQNTEYLDLCISEVYLKLNLPDSALIFANQAYEAAEESRIHALVVLAFRILGDIYLQKGDDKTALDYYRRYIPAFIKYRENNRDLGFVYNSMSGIFKARGQTDSSVFYAKKALVHAREFQDQENICKAAGLLYEFYSLPVVYKRTPIDSLQRKAEAFTYFKIATAAKDSLSSFEKIKQIQSLTFNEQVREKQQAEADARERQKRTLLIVIGSILAALITFLVWNRIRQLRLQHKMILEQKEAEKLKAIDKMKERFFSNVTHELRTPLSLILSPVERYLNHPEELTDTRKLLQTVYNNSEYLLTLINQLLDISKLDAGQMNTSLSSGNFGNFVLEIASTFSEDCNQRRISLDIQNGISGDYLFDAEHWKKIVNNLLSNAIKFTAAGGSIHITIDPIQKQSEKDIISVAITDTGIGINDHQLPFVTNRFYQADNSATRNYPGTGIGLSLVNELVRLMDGELEIISEEGKGSVFTIRMALTRDTKKQVHPRAMASVKKMRRSTSESSSHPLTVSMGKKELPLVLVVEDHAELRDFITESLQFTHRVITAADGDEGWSLTLTELPEIIISDVMMPMMDGFEFCERVKTNAATSHIGFIMLTAKANLEEKLAGLKVGADDYLTKPFHVDELRSRIDNILDHQQKLRGHYLSQLISDDLLPQSNSVQDEFLQKTYKNIEDNLDNETLDVETLAEKMTVNRSVLDKKLATVIGLSANELIRQYRKRKSEMQKEMLELEARALRAQMNPHFIFNCMNSIKSLILQNEQDKAIDYLTTFSKLIRTIFHNSDKREITLYDEIETCRLYVQLESMRFDAKFGHHFMVDTQIDLKSVFVPALIIQPFIENAIWHGIMPKPSGGTVSVIVEREGDGIRCIIDDDGIGVELSRQNQFKGKLAMHQSRGVHLTQSRLNLNNLLNSRSITVETIDKKNADGKAVGTRVVLLISEY